MSRLTSYCLSTLGQRLKSSDMLRALLSLKGVLVLSFVSFALVLVLGYSWLSSRQFMSGIDTMIADNMVGSVRQFVRHNDRNHPRSPDFVSRDWATQPTDVRAAFPTPPKEQNRLYKGIIPEAQRNNAVDEDRKAPQLVFVMRYQMQGQNFYISHKLMSRHVSHLVGLNARQSRQQLLLVGCLSLLALIFIVWWLLKRAARPVHRLGQWARQLNADNLDQSIPDFVYPDLNAFAERVQGSLSSAHQALLREQTFLRHTSHELRTPISVIRNNVELLHKLQQKQKASASSTSGPLDIQQASAAMSHDWSSKMEAALNRIDRASLTMKDLTETLLWLSREEVETLPTQTFDLAAMLTELTESLRYLIQTKTIHLTLTTAPCVTTQPEGATRIILGNLIRNAFQHTHTGRVEIQQQGLTVTIHNQNDATESAPSLNTCPPNTLKPEDIKPEENLGFGLGLTLTQRLTERLNWDYHHDLRLNGRHIWLQLPTPSKGPHSD